MSRWWKFGALSSRVGELVGYVGELARFAWKQHGLRLAFINAVLVAMAVSLETLGAPSVGWMWTCRALVYGVLVAYWTATALSMRKMSRSGHWDGRDLKQELRDETSTHTTDLWDNAPYTCVHGVLPDSRTKRCAWPKHHAPGTPEPTDVERSIKVPR